MLDIQAPFSALRRSAASDRKARRGDQRREKISDAHVAGRSDTAPFPGRHRFGLELPFFPILLPKNAVNAE